MGDERFRGFIRASLDPMSVVVVGGNLGASGTKDGKVDVRRAGRLFEFPAYWFGRKRGSFDLITYFILTEIDYSLESLCSKRDGRSSS